MFYLLLWHCIVVSLCETKTGMNINHLYTMKTSYSYVTTRLKIEKRRTLLDVLFSKPFETSVEKFNISLI
jgi:hypothetical protein